MKAIIILALCAATVLAQTTRGPPPPKPPPPCVPNASLGITQANCDSLQACMQVRYPKPAPGSPPPSSADGDRAAKRAYETNCAAQAGISTTVLEAIRAQRGPPPPPPPTATGRK